MKVVGNTTITKCNGIYIKEGGNSSSWTVGASDIAANTGNTTPFDFPANSTSGTTRLVPFVSTRPITVHINTINVEGNELTNVEVTSSQSVKLAAGRSYTMNVKMNLVSLPGIKVPASEINLGGTECTASDKSSLAKLTWGLGNLNRGGSDGYCTWTSDQSAIGYYYPWNTVLGSTFTTPNTDPCTMLIASKYGIGWRTPSSTELEMLARCSDKELTGEGMWFMNKTIGVYLKAGGFRSGPGSLATSQFGTHGAYWSSTASDSNIAFPLIFSSGQAYVASDRVTQGFFVRCVNDQ